MAEAPADDNLCADPAEAQVAIDAALDNIPIYVYISPSSLAEGRTHEAPLWRSGPREGRRRCGAPSFGADIGENPTSAGGAPGGAGPYVIGLARLEAAGPGNRALP